MSEHGSGTTENERNIAKRILNQILEEEHMVEERITINKGISGNSIIVRRKDGMGACTIMMPISKPIALRFVRQSLRMSLNIKEEEFVCRNLS